jgi:hypothetical protein
MNATRVRNRRTGFTLIELIAILIVIALTVVLFFAKSRARADHFYGRAWINCVNNLKQVGLSFRIFANYNEDLYPMRLPTDRDGTLEDVPKPSRAWRHFQVLSNELSTPKVLICPADIREPATNFATLTNTNISYFIGLDADETRPGMLLAGDRNLQQDGIPYPPGIWQLRTNRNITWGPGLHTRKGSPACGNVALADGSVQQLTTRACERFYAPRPTPRTGS